MCKVEMNRKSPRIIDNIENMGTLIVSIGSIA